MIDIGIKETISRQNTWQNILPNNNKDGDYSNDKKYPRYNFSDFSSTLFYFCSLITLTNIGSF